MSDHDEVGVKVQRAQLALAQVRGRTQFGGVSIEVDADNQLTDLQLSDAALDHGATRLAELIAQAYRNAVAGAATQVRAATAELTSDPDVVRMAETLGTPTGTPRPVGGDDDEVSWIRQQGSVLQRADERPRRHFSS